MKLLSKGSQRVDNYGLLSVVMTEDYDHDELIAKFLRKLSEAAKDKGVVCGRLQENKPYISKQVAKGMEMNYVFHKNSPYRIEMWIYHRKEQGGVEATKEVFEHFHSKKREIESDYGGPLTWDYNRRKAKSIQQEYDDFQLSTESEWDQWIDRIVNDMKRLDDSLVPHYINTRN